MRFLYRIYKKLLSTFGKQGWWPGETPFEIIVGAILTQQTNWKNVERAIQNLKREKLLNPEALYKVSSSKIKKLIRPTIYYNQKTKKLKAFVKYLIEKYRGNLKALFNKKVSELRAELLSLHGIGKETADSIILYAAEKPIFVIDAYTKRIGKRLGLFDFEDYEKIRNFFERNLPKSVYIYKEFHALLVELGKRFCKRKPICDECPFRKVCKYISDARSEVRVKMPV